MKPAKLKFGAYFMAMHTVPQQTSRRSVMWNVYMSILSLGVMFVFTIRFGASAMPAAVFLCGFAVIAICAAAEAVNLKPSLFNLLPVSPARSVAYYLLSVLLMTLITVVIIFAFLLVFSALSALIVLAFGGSQESPPAEEPVEEIIYTVSAQGELLGVFMTLALLGLVMAVMFLRRDVVKRILVVAAPAAIWLPATIYALVLKVETGLLFAEFGSLPLSALMLVIYGLIAAVSVGLGLWQVCRKFRPKKF